MDTRSHPMFCVVQRLNINAYFLCSGDLVDHCLQLRCVRTIELTDRSLIGDLDVDQRLGKAACQKLWPNSM